MTVLIVAGMTLLIAGHPFQSQNPPPRPSPRTLDEVPPDQMSVELSLSGRVLMADGSSVPANVEVNLICGGALRRQTHAAGNGDFSLQLGGPPTATTTDARVSGGERDYFGRRADDTRGGNAGSRRDAVQTGRVELLGCSIQAYSPGYQSTALNLDNRSGFDSPFVGDLFLHRLGAAAETAVSVTTLAAPPKAVKAFEKARREFEKKKFDRAIREARRAVEIYPDYTIAWNLLGAASNALNDAAGAAEAFEQASAIDPAYLPPLISLARIRVRQRRFGEAAQLSGKVIQARPLVYDALYIHSLSHYNLGNLDMALKYIEAYLARPDQVNPTAHLLHGFVLAEKRQFPAAAEALERFLTSVPEGPSSEEARARLQQWQQQGLVGESKDPGVR